ncbi:hypothetical protein HN873_004372 [Arachis hypogaea]|uniref:Uncharacterized protein n=1 Tax=Arachis hypogaea TaxID=3818 RepID=A0A445EGF9_ARAHY|nr:hypothetical protein Ahy_A02g009236 [Arachis hypogaea]
MLHPATAVEAGRLRHCSNFEATVVAATGLASFLHRATTVPPRHLCSTASAPPSCFLSRSGSENCDTVNYATVVREVKEYLKKGVAVKELQSHIAVFPVSAQEKMNALLEGLFDVVEKAFGKEATKRKNHLAGAVAGDDEGSQLLLLNAAPSVTRKVAMS